MDNFEWEELGMKAHPVMDKLDPKSFDGYPYVFIDGIEIEPGETDVLKITIATILSNELILDVRVGDLVISPGN
jgi:hypothetical protein